MSRILIACHETGTSGILRKIFKTEGYKPVSVAHAKDAGELLETEEFNLLVYNADLQWDPEMGLLKIARDNRPNMPVMVLVDSKDMDLIENVKGYKPFALAEKPLKIQDLMSKVQEAIDFSDSTLSESVNLNLQLESVYKFGEIVAESPAMKSVCDMVNRIAATEVPVLISGETGTGKKSIARIVHRESRRSGKDLTEVDSGAEDVADTLFGNNGKYSLLEKSAGGTLLVDDIEKLPLDVQARLAECLKAGSLKKDSGSIVEFDARVIATASGNPDTLVKEGKLDSELYKFLRVLFIRIPPLRKRREDILATARRLLRDMVGENSSLPTLEPKAASAMENYTWPENVKELRDVLESAAEKMGEDRKITASCLPDYLTAV